MLYRLRRFLETKSQLWLREIHNTPPLEGSGRGPVFVSQLAAVYVEMFLLAAKSMGVWIKPSRCIVLSDGTLRRSHERLLEQHLPNLEVRHLKDIDVGTCPRGGTWERLVTCVEESAGAFVLQIDSDTVTYDCPDAIMACLASNRSYTMSGCVTDSDRSRIRVMSLAEAAEVRQAELTMNNHPHVQIVAETSLPRIPTTLGSRYIRGSSGYAGFAAGQANLSELEEFSSAMSTLLGTRWREWGTEQVASNFIIANSPGGMVLPWPDYASQKPQLAEDQVAIHFTGEHRFAYGTYRRVGCRAMNLMKGPPTLSR